MKKEKGKVLNLKLSKSKNAQVTIFIIIAVILVSAVVIYFIASGISIKNLFSPKDEIIYSFVQECIKSTGGEIIYSIGERGGYYIPPEFSTDTGVPIYYENNKIYIPSKEQVGQEISKGLNEEMQFCIKDFKEFKDYSIKQGEIKTEARIIDNKIILNVNYPLTITKGEKTTYLEEFKGIEIPARLGIVYDAVNEITQNQLTNKKYKTDGKTREGFCMSCISKIASENDLYVNMITYDENTTLFVVRDDNSKINNAYFEYYFANKYMIE